MKALTFSKRCMREILRDPINLCFGLGFPLVLLFLLSRLQKNIPADLYNIDTLTPGISVFGLSFLCLFSATLISKDRDSAFLQRLYTTPLTALDFILGYMLPILPLAIGQCAVCYLFAILLGLTVSVNIVYAILGLIPMALFYIALGLLFGSILGVKQVGGICGALLTNLSAWLSGVWFDLELVGGAFANKQRSEMGKGHTFSLKFSFEITVTASGFFISEPSFAKILLKLTPTEMVIPSSRLISLLILLAISKPSPKSTVLPVTSSQHSSMPNGSTISVYLS